MPSWMEPPAIDPSPASALLRDAAALPGFGTDVPATLAWVARAGREAPLPGEDTAGLWSLLAATSRLDVGAARMLEPHLDALAILAQARAGSADAAAALGADAEATWGVFAAEPPGAPPGGRVHAVRAADGSWALSGTKPWCSLAEALSHALVTAWTADGERGLFAIDLRAEGVAARPGPWAARGLARIVSAPVDLDRVRAAPVGEPGWYLRRPGFSWGGMGVAAVWWGGALPLVDVLAAAARREDADQLSAVYAGRADAASWAASVVLSRAAAEIDVGAAAGTTLLAARVRALIARAVRDVLAWEAEALGPGRIATDDAHARRVADLDVYVRQDHADRDLARLGRLATRGGAP